MPRASGSQAAEADAGDGVLGCDAREAYRVTGAALQRWIVAEVGSWL
jgi:hypothetical protein